MNTKDAFLIVVFFIGTNISWCQNNNDTFKHGVYYQFQQVKHYDFIDSHAKNGNISHDSIAVDSVSSVKRGTIITDGSMRGRGLDIRIDSSASSSREVPVQEDSFANTQKRIESSASGSNDGLVQVDDFVNMQKRIDNLERKQKKNAALSIDAGIYLEKAASDEKASIVIACIGGAISGLVAGLTIPYGGETALGGTIASSVIGGTAAIVSFSFHCVAIKNVRRAGKMLSAQQR